MGYYIQPDSVRGDATPKTHTPGSRMQELGHRSYTPYLGRWTSRDPLGERGSRNLHAFVRNSALSRCDPLGLQEETEWDGTIDWGGEGIPAPAVDPSRYVMPGPMTYGKLLTQDEIRTRPAAADWLQRFRELYRGKIDEAARKHCVPRRLLALMVANERMERNTLEGVLDRFGSSLGLAQVETDWATRIYRDESIENLQSRLRRDNDFNLDVAAATMRSFLSDLCAGALATEQGAGGFSPAFLREAEGHRLLPSFPDSEYPGLCCAQTEENCGTLWDAPLGVSAGTMMAYLWNTDLQGWRASAYGGAPHDSAQYMAFLNGQQVEPITSWIRNNW